MSETNLNLPGTVAEQLSPTQKGWLVIGERTGNTFKSLQAQELEIQSIVSGYETSDLDAVQSKLKKAKAKAAEAKDERLSFTRMIEERLTGPSMMFEKRNDELLGKVSARELQLRKEQAAKDAEANAKEAEKAALKAFMINEWNRISTSYKINLNQVITQAYTTALEDKIATQDLPEYLAGVKKLLSEIPQGAKGKFDLKLLSKEEAMEVYKTVSVPDMSAILSAAQSYMENNVFAMYEQDLQNTEKAAEAHKKLMDEQAAKDKEKMEMEAASITLMSQAEPLVMNSGAKVKKIMKVKREESERFALTVIRTAIANWPDFKDKMAVKSWLKLVDPFVKALDKMDTQFDGLQYEEIEK